MPAMRIPRFGVMTNHTVSATKTTSAPMFRKFLPGSIIGLESIRADSFRKATIEPVKVTAPMKTPTITSPWWMPRRSVEISVCASPLASTV